MDGQLITICLLTGIINLIGALAYAARIAGVRTRRIALSFALFNILVLVSRTANGFLAPFIAKRIETALLVEGGGAALLWDLRLVLVSAAIAVAIGILLVPTGQRLFARAIVHFQDHRSVSRLIMRSATPAGLHTVRNSLAFPSRQTASILKRPHGIGWGVLIANCLAQALLAVGVLAALYAGYLNPEFRVTASQLSAVVNGVATILLFALIDPQISAMTDDVVDGAISDGFFRRTLVWISLSRFAGTLLAQILLVPAAWLIGEISNAI